MLGSALLLAAVQAVALEKDSTAPQPPEPVKQPVEFSHRRHAELGLECTACHPMTGGEQAGLPQTEDCLACHEGNDGSKPPFLALFEHAQAKKPIAWARVYVLQSFVSFTHPSHLRAKGSCETCHGPVASRDLLWKEWDLSMKACVDCHKTSQASVSCTLCHELNQ
jgi:hypothetical protein